MLLRYLEQIKAVESHINDISKIIEKRKDINKISDEEVYIVSYMLFNVINECLMICRDIVKEKNWISGSETNNFTSAIDTIFKIERLPSELYLDIKFLIKYRNNLRIVLFTRNLGKEALKEAYRRLPSLIVFLRTLRKKLEEGVTPHSPGAST